MADDTTRAELAQLRAELAAQRDEVAVLRQAMTASKPRRFPRLSRRFVPIALVAVLMVLTPLTLLAANPFTDLVPGSVHNGNIDLIYTAGITTGCVPNAQYCPTDNVTRQEMASFLARTAGLGSNPPVVNAKMLNGVPAANFVQTGSNATLGNLTVTGTINTAFTNGTTNRATPIAYGYVSAAGALVSGTPNVSVVYVPGVSQHYEITITGETFVYNEYQALVTPTYSVVTTPHIVNTSSDSGKLLVYVYLPTTGAITSGAFQFAIFKP
jgi:hypothetical protein